MSDEWVQMVEESSGRTYYYNERLGQTSWQKPSGDQKFNPDAWIEKVDDDGRQFWFNKETKIRSYISPFGTSAEERSSARVGLTLNRGGVTALRPESMQRRSGRVDSIKFGTNAPPAEDKFQRIRNMRNAEDVAKHASQIDLDRMSMAMHQAVDVDKKDLREYAQSNYKLVIKGGMMAKSKPLAVDTLLQWDKVPLVQSLHGMSHPTLEKQALIANKSIMGYMGDYKSKKFTTITKNLYQLLNIGIVDSPEELRDEVFCQIVKQVRHNPFEGSCQKGWILMAICAGSFPPSHSFEPYLTSFLKESCNGSPYPGVETYAKYALLRLKKSIEVGPRQEVPCGIEIDCISHRRPVPVAVFLANETQLAFETETWTTVGDLRRSISSTLNILDDRPFALMEASGAGGESERLLEDDEKVLDVLAFWEAERFSYKDISAAPINRFVYKIHLFLDIDEEDTSAIELAYYQATFDVTDSRYPVSEFDVVNLVALEAQEKYGDYTGEDVFQDDFAAFLPLKFTRQAKKLNQMKKLVYERYQELSGMSKIDVKKKYLDYVKKWKVYGAQSFFVEPQNNPSIPKMVILSVNGHGVLIIDPKNKEILSEFPWKNIMTWGHAPTNFCLVLGTYMEQTKLWFKPTSQDENTILYGLVEAYGAVLKDH